MILTMKRKGREAEKAEKGKNNRSKEGSGGMGDLGWGRESSKVRSRSKETSSGEISLVN